MVGGVPGPVVVGPRGGVDDLDKPASLGGTASPRRSTSSLDGMADDSANIFGSRVTWRAAIFKAVLIEGALMFLVLPGLAISGGAANPFGFYWALFLQFPAPLPFPPFSPVPP